MDQESLFLFWLREYRESKGKNTDLLKVLYYFVLTNAIQFYLSFYLSLFTLISFPLISAELARRVENCDTTFIRLRLEALRQLEGNPYLFGPGAAKRGKG